MAWWDSSKAALDVLGVLSNIGDSMGGFCSKSQWMEQGLFEIPLGCAETPGLQTINQENSNFHLLMQNNPKHGELHWFFLLG